MQDCKTCRALWPFGLALVLSLLVSFPAWATFSLMDVTPPAQVAGTALFFAVIATGLLLYVRWCIRRDCALRRAVAARRGGEAGLAQQRS